MPSPDAMLPLIADIGKCQTLNQLIRTLLMYCRDNSDVYRNWNLSHTNATIVRGWEQLAFELARGLQSSLFDEDTAKVQKFFFDNGSFWSDRQILKMNVEATPLVVPSRALVSAIGSHNELLQKAILQDSLAVGGVCASVAPDQLFPVIRPTLAQMKRWYGVTDAQSLATNPESLIPPIDSLPSFGLAPPQNHDGPRIEIHLAHRAANAPFHNECPLKFGVGILNAVSAELGVPVPCSPPHDEDTFFGIGPVDTDVQIARMREIFQKAVAENVDVLVFPELCTNLKIATQLMNEFSASSGSMTVFVAGSYHCAQERKNIAVGRVRDGRNDLRHEKMERYILKGKNWSGGRDLEEGINLGPSVCVYQWKNWSATILICIDAISIRVQSTISTARPHMILLPAYTGRTSDFVRFADIMVGIQAATVMGNGPIPNRGAVGVFAVPVLDENGRNCIVEATISQTAPIPQLCVFDGATQQCRFV